MNSITIFGRLGKDAETRDVGQHKVTTLALACNKVKRQGEEKAGTDWYEVSVWNKANLAPHLKKGTALVVSGRLELQTFTRTDGTQGSKLAVNCHDISFAGGAPSSNGAAPAPAPAKVTPPPAVQQASLDDLFNSDEIPF